MISEMVVLVPVFLPAVLIVYIDFEVSLLK